MAVDGALMEALGILAETANSVYQTQAEREFRENESYLDRIHQESQLYLTNSLNLLTQQIDQRNELKVDAGKLGLTDMDLTKVDPKNQSSGSKAVIKTQLGTTVSNINHVNSEIDALTYDIGNYYKGLSLGKMIDTDISGTISSEGAGSELSVFSQGVGEEYAHLINKTLPDGSINPEYSTSFNLGVKSYTLDPTIVSALKLDKQKQYEYEVKNLYLEDQLIDEAAMREVDLGIGKQTLENLEETYLQIKANTEHIKTSSSLNEASTQGLIQKLEEDQFAYDEKRRDNAKQEVGEVLTLNYQMQGELGASILTSVNLQYQDNVFIPFMAIIGNEAGAVLHGDANLTKILKSDQFSHIATDINMLVSAYSIGVSDATVQQWDPVLSILRDIKGQHADLKAYVANGGSDVYTRMNKTGDFSDKQMKAFITEVAGSTLSKGDQLRVVKALQWDQTGIFNALEEFNQLDKVDLQVNQLLEIQGQIHMTDMDQALQLNQSVNSGTTYKMTKVKNIRSK